MVTHNYLMSYPYSAVVYVTPNQIERVIYRLGNLADERAYLPLFKRVHIHDLSVMGEDLETVFEVHKYKTLAIVGFFKGEGSVEETPWILKNAKFQASYPLTMFSPGGSPEAIVETVINFEQFFEQFIMLTYPSTVKSLIKCAEELGIQLPLAKMRFVIGEDPSLSQDNCKAKQACQNTKNLWLQFLAVAHKH